VTDVTLVIAGEGPNRIQLEALVGTLGLSESVSMPGFVQDTASLYRHADLFVCSSRFEGFGNVIVEALSYGLRVVSTRCPHGPDEILCGGLFGRLVETDDASGLAEAIVAALQESPNEAALKARAMDFSLSSIGDRYLAEAGLVSPPVDGRNVMELKA
jgi:glycosyltransferase involved in cell wall biosynthesis